MSRVLITGGAGMIGSYLAKELSSLGYSIVVYDLAEQFERKMDYFNALSQANSITICQGTILDRYKLSESAAGCDVVIHLAAMLGVKRTEDNRLECLNTNINGTVNALDASISCGARRFIFASSSEVYGEPNYNPIDEDAELKGKTVYAISKLAGEEYVKGYSQIHHGFNYTILRFFNTYGESQVNQFVLSRFVDKVTNELDPEVYGDGRQMRSYCHVSDACRGIRLAMESKKAVNEVFNIGNSDECFTLLDAAQAVISTLKPNTKLAPRLVPFSESDRDESREIFQRVCSIKKAREVLGYNPTTKLTEGIKRMAESKSYNSWVDHHD